jgi:transcription initiation factor TFIID subunit 15
MGKIPSKTNMVSSLVVFPEPGSVIEPLTTFNIDVQTSGLAAGAFTNAQLTYYSAPQDLNSQGQIIGHTHVTVQDMGNSLTPKGTLDPTTFAFFKGINDAGNGKGLLSAVVTGGLPAGFYRVCTMSSSSNHQPVLMPVAQRGAQDDCTKFEVRPGGTATNTGSNQANTGGNQANTGGNQANNGGNAAASTSAAAAATSAATGKGRGRGGKKTTSAVGAAATSVAGNVKAVSSTKAATASPTAAVASTAGAAGSTAISIKSGTLGGAAPQVLNSGMKDRPFSVNGNTFVNTAAAVQRSCDIQFNKCADAVNGGRLAGKTLNDCNTQKSTCGQ